MPTWIRFGAKSLTAAVSVISTFRSGAGSSCLRSAVRMSSTSVLVPSWIGEILTQIALGMPASAPLRAWAQTWSITHRPMV